MKKVNVYITEKELKRAWKDDIINKLPKPNNPANSIMNPYREGENSILKRIKEIIKDTK